MNEVPVQKKRILFLTTHNAARSQIAEGFINAMYDDHYVAFSAGSEPTSVHPCVVRVMEEVGVDLGSQDAKSIDRFEGVHFDYVVSLCADDEERCPVFPGGAVHLQHAFPNPITAIEQDGEACTPVREARDHIREWLEATFGGDTI